MTFCLRLEHGNTFALEMEQKRHISSLDKKIMWKPVEKALRKWLIGLQSKSEGQVNFKDECNNNLFNLGEIAKKTDYIFEGDVDREKR